MTDQQKIKEIKKVLDSFKKFEAYALSLYVESLKKINEIVNNKKEEK